VAGEGRDHVAALVLPGLAACRGLAGDDTGALSPAQLCAHPSVVARLADLLRDFSVAHPGSSTALARAILLDEPPSIDAQEITDKGSLNQRAVLRRRARLVDELYGEPDSPRVIDSSKGLM
jgi:feruloyl-CoA synthase